MTLKPNQPGAIEVDRVAYLRWVRIPDVGILDYGHPEVIPLATPKREWVFPPIDKRTHRAHVPGEDNATAQQVGRKAKAR